MKPVDHTKQAVEALERLRVMWQNIGTYAQVPTFRNTSYEQVCALKEAAARETKEWRVAGDVVARWLRGWAL